MCHPVIFSPQNSWEGRQPRHPCRNVADAPGRQDAEPGSIGGGGGRRERGGGDGGGGDAAGVLQSHALGADDTRKGLLLNGRHVRRGVLTKLFLIKSIQGSYWLLHRSTLLS